MNAQQFVDLMSECGYRPKSYSGRGMYGERCVSVNLDRHDIASFGSRMAEACPEGQSVADLLSRYSQDSMGLGVVLYWRSLKADGVKFPSNEDDEEL